MTGALMYVKKIVHAALFPRSYRRWWSKQYAKEVRARGLS